MSHPTFPISHLLFCLGVTEYNTAFALIEDIFDSQLISELEMVFSLIEVRASFFVFLSLTHFSHMSEPILPISHLEFFSR